MPNFRAFYEDITDHHPSITQPKKSRRDEMRINRVCAIVISPFTEFWGGRERGFFFTAHFTPSLRSTVIKMRFLASKTDRDRRDVGDDFSPRISGIQDHFGARKAVGFSVGSVRPRFNSCPSCSVTFRQLHCQVRAWVQQAAPTCGGQPHK